MSHGFLPNWYLLKVQKSDAYAELLIHKLMFHRNFKKYPLMTLMISSLNFLHRNQLGTFFQYSSFSTIGTSNNFFCLCFALPMSSHESNECLICCFIQSMSESIIKLITLICFCKVEQRGLK